MCPKSTREDKPLTQQDIWPLEIQLMKVIKQNPDDFVKKFNANPNDYENYHTAIIILKSHVDIDPNQNAIRGYIKEVLNQLKDPYLWMREELKDAFRTELFQAASDSKAEQKRDAILSKMSLPALTKLHKDCVQYSQKVKDAKSQGIYENLMTTIEQNIEKHNPKKSSGFKDLFKQSMFHRKSKQLGQKLKDIKNKMPNITLGRRK